MKIYVHDFLIDYLGALKTGDVCCGVDVYYTIHLKKNIICLMSQILRLSYMLLLLKVLPIIWKE